MRSRIFLYAFIFVAGSLALPAVVHAAIPFFGPVIDPSWTVPSNLPGGAVQCPLGWGALITVINNVIELLITLALVILLPIMVAYAGFMIVTSQGNSGKITQARKMILNTILGIVVALAAWLIVDALMAVLYHPDSSTGWTTTWSSLITSGNALNCLQQQGVGTGSNQSTNGAGVAVATTASSGGSKLNVAAAVAWLSTNITTTQDAGICLTDIEKAFSAGGLTLSCPRGYAGQCNSSLQALGFTSLGSSDSSPKPGDVIVVQHINGANSIGHIAMFTGSVWISDFVQSTSESPPGNPYVSNQFGGAQYWRP